MSNSIIDQQRDNEDFTEVFCVSWSSWLGADFDKVSSLNNMRGIVDHRQRRPGTIDELIDQLQHMLNPFDK